MTDAFTVATWNTQWATLKTDRGRRVAAKLADSDADVLVVTEGARELLPKSGSAVDAGADWGYSLQSIRRKVIIWSRFAISLEIVADKGAARGRLAVANVATPSGRVRVVGVCIPWRDAHVSTGRSDASPWSEHMEYLDQIEMLMGQLDGEVPTVLAGDFNQRIPRGRQPIRVSERLEDVFSHLTIHTVGQMQHGPHIDHIASSSHLACKSASDWSSADELRKLSDHSGVSCRFAPA
jgi:endonuclease/exonuclease/phosphatase family metal-dependent hydrolase